MSYDIEIRDVDCGAGKGPDLSARLYRPTDDGPFPAVVDIHGGAWHGGDYLNDAPVCELLARAGVVALSLDFRKPPEYPYPEPIADVSYGIRWLKANAESCGTSASMVGGIGMSSGGHMLVLAAMRPGDERYAKHMLASDDGSNVFDSSLRFAVLCYPIVDPLARYRMSQQRSTQEHYGGLVASHQAFFPRESDMEEGNPQLILERGEVVELPPALLIQGTADDNVTPDMADRFADAYRGAGGEIALEKYEGEAHGFIRREPLSSAAHAAVDRMVEFIFDVVAEATILRSAG